MLHHQGHAQKTSVDCDDRLFCHFLGIKEGDQLRDLFHIARSDNGDKAPFALPACGQAIINLNKARGPAVAASVDHRAVAKPIGLVIKMLENDKCLIAYTLVVRLF